MLKSHEIDLQIRAVVASQRQGATVKEIVEMSGLPPTVVRQHLRGLVRLQVLKRTSGSRLETTVWVYGIK